MEKVLSMFRSGSYKKPPICDEENLRKISGLLKNVTVQFGDYSECKSFIDSQTFVYIDPPYRPLNATSSFTSYTENGFGDKEQIELGKFVDEISAKEASKGRCKQLRPQEQR